MFESHKMNELRCVIVSNYSANDMAAKAGQNSGSIQNCEKCGKPVQNGTRSKMQEANCLTVEMAKAIVRAENAVYQSHSAGIPLCPKMRKPYAGGNRTTISRNILSALKPLREWKGLGYIPAAPLAHLQHFHNEALIYICTHHSLLPQVTQHVVAASTSNRIDSAHHVDESSDDDHETVPDYDTEVVCVPIDEDISMSSCDEFSEAEVSDVDEGHLTKMKASSVFKLPEKKYSICEVMEIYKAIERPSDRSLTKLLTLLHRLKPTPDYDKLPKKGRALCEKRQKAAVASVDIRRVDCGFTVGDGERFHPKPGRPTPFNIPKPVKGDVVDFGIESSILLTGHGNTNGCHHRRLLQRLNAAYPDLLSETLLKVADEALYYQERRENRLGRRPKMNFFSLKGFVDGMQIANNSAKPQAYPTLATIERICKYDPDDPNTFPEYWKTGIKIPLQFSQPFIVNIYHGKKKPNIFQFYKKMFQELRHLDPHKKMPAKARSITAQLHCMICDSPMQSWISGNLLPIG
jgi:hypothetical protein